jgi:fucose permease
MRLRSPVFLAVAAFVVTGMVTTVLGPILPDLLIRWHLSDAAAGALFSAQFSGGLVGGAASGPLAASFGDARTLALGYAAMTLGLIVLAVGSHGAGVAGALLAGLGVGFVVPATNLLVARRQAARAASALGALNLVWGLGASAWPLVVSLVSYLSAPRAALVPLALVAAMTSAAILRAGDDDARQSTPASASSGSAVGVTQLLVYGCAIFVYSGIEMSLGGWLPEFAKRTVASDAARAATVGTAFWAGLSAGRAAIAVRLDRRHEDAVLFAGLLMAGVGVVALLRAQAYPVVLAGAGLSGVGLGPIFPVTAAAVSRRMPTRIAGPLLSLGMLGGAVLPWFVGVVSDAYASLASGFAAVLVFLGALVGLHALRRTGDRAAALVHAEGAPAGPP